MKTARQAKRADQNNVSILLIVELAFEVSYPGAFESRIIKFQSFLSWNWLLKFIAENFPWSQALVSILLIVELAFEAGRMARYPSNNEQFQSFLSWNWLLKRLWRHLSCPFPGVSILLIVELAFEGDFQVLIFNTL